MTATIDATETRRPPQDEAAEQSVLGGMLLSKSAITDAAELVRVEDFYQPKHQTVFAAVMDLYQRGEPVDAITIGAELEARNALARIGGAPYLHTLIATVPTAANAGYYAEIVAEKAVLRRLIEAGTRIVQLGHGAGDATGVAEHARKALDEAVDTTQRGDGPITAEAAAAGFLEHLSAPKQPTVSTGLDDLDRMLSGGLKPNAVYTVAARPGVGKSVVAANISAAAAREGTSVLVASLEMGRNEIMACWFAAEKRIERSHLVQPELMDDRDWKLVAEAHDEIAQWPLYVWDEPYISTASLRARARELKRTADLGLLVVDYLQLMQPADGKAPRQEQVSAMSRGIKLLAKELQIPVVQLAQLNRGPEQRTDKKPQLSDLRESGAIENDSDAVLMLWLDESKPDNGAGELEIHVAKNRAGRCGDVSLSYAKHYARIRNLYRD